MARTLRMTIGGFNARRLHMQQTPKLGSINALICYAVCRLEGITKLTLLSGPVCYVQTWSCGEGFT